MSSTDSPLTSPLLRHLALALGVKLFALVFLWWFVVREQSAVVDAHDTAMHLVTPIASPDAAQSPHAGASR